MTVRVLVLLSFAAPALAQEAPAPEGKFVTVNGAEMYYEEHGAGPPLLLVHAFGATGSEWARFVPAFAEQYRVIVPDLPGHGRSTNRDTNDAWAFDEVAHDLLAFMDTLRLPQTYALGGSAGGAVVLIAATLQPQRFAAIASVGGPPYRSKETRRWLEQHASGEVWEGAIEQHGAERAAALARQFRNFKDLYGDLALTPDLLSTITGRTLLVHGDDDALVPVHLAWKTYTALPDAHLWIVPHGGHLPYRDPANAQVFTQRILAFFSGAWEE